MGFDNDCIINIQSLAGEYFCALCRTLVYPNEAIQAPCTHLFCKPCVEYVSNTTHACPYDGYRVTIADSKPLLESNKGLAGTIEKVQVHCLYYRTGCTWKGSLSDCGSHSSTCAFGESAVVCNRCGAHLKHRLALEHRQNCSGVQSRVQQPSGVQDSKSTGAMAAPEQIKAMVPTAVPASQATSQASTMHVAGHDANLTVNSATQPQASQAIMPTPEQMYQQPQYQQYYQLYPGYYAYQQNYQNCYQYLQMAQQYQQQLAQGHPQLQGYGSQTYPVDQLKKQVLSQDAQPQAQATANAHFLAPTAGTAPQPTLPAQPPMTAKPSMPAQPQVPAEMATKQLQVPQYPPTHPQMQQSETQHYPHAHPQAQLKPHSLQNFQALYHASQHPISHNMQLKTPNAVAGYQSYQQPLPLPRTHHSHHIQGRVPSQTAEMHPQPYPNVPNQKHPPMPYAQGQVPSGPSVQQPPVFPDAQQQSFPAQGPLMQQQPSAAAQMHGRGQGPAQMSPQSQSYGQPRGAQPNGAYNYEGMPMGVQEGSAGQARPQFNNYPMKTNGQLLSAEQKATQSQRVPSSEKSRDPMTEKGVYRQTNTDKAVKDMTAASSAGGRGDDTKMTTKDVSGASLDENDSGSYHSKSKQMPDAKTKVDNHVQEAKPKTKGDTGEGSSKSSGVADKNGAKNPKDSVKGEVQELKHTAKHAADCSASPSSLPKPHVQSAGILGPGSAVSQGSRPPHQANSAQNFLGGPLGRYPGDVKFGVPRAHVSMSALGMRGERAMPSADEHVIPFDHREFEGDFRKFPRPLSLEAGSSSDYRPRLLDHGSHMFGEDGVLRLCDKRPHGFNLGPGVGSGPSRVLPPFGPKDVGENTCFFPNDEYLGFPSRTFGLFGDFDGMESKSYNFPAEQLGNPMQDSIFHGPSRGDRDVPGFFGQGENLALSQGFMPSHLLRGGPMGPGGLYLGEATTFGRPGGPSAMVPLLGNLPFPVPSANSFGGENRSNLPQGVPGFRSDNRFPDFAHNDGFYASKRQKTRDGVLRIQQQNKKKPKVSNGQASVEEGRDEGRRKKSEFQGRGNNR